MPRRRPEFSHTPAPLDQGLKNLNPHMPKLEPESLELLTLMLLAPDLYFVDLDFSYPETLNS